MTMPSLHKLAALAVCCVVLLARPASASVTATDAWARATAPQAKTGAVYMTLENTGTEEDALTGISTGQSVIAVIHVSTSTTVNGAPVTIMDTAKDLKIPANGTLSLVPGGAHIMLDTLKSPLREGSTFPMTLYFANSPEITVYVRVGSAGASGP